MEEYWNAKYDSSLSTYNVTNFGMRVNIENTDVGGGSGCGAWKCVSGLLQAILAI